ncbi:MAG: pyruvate, phosphate dikinase, partial [Actinomycetota bacterium]
MSIVRIKTGASIESSPDTIGAKAATLARVAGFGLPVPPAFVLPIELGAALMQGDKDAEDTLTSSLA